jgi:Tfp pilus assembly protein PilV
MRRLTQERGFTIVEMMVAALVVLTGALGTMAMLDTANKRSRGAADRQTGTALARQVLEAAKSVPYRDVAPASIVSRLREDVAVGGISASPWQVERDNTTFTLEVDVCWLDDPADGLGSRAAGNFCAGSGTGGTEDGNAIDHKRVVVVASWENSSGEGSARQSTLISARGGLDAPGVSSIQLTSPTASPITNPLTASASFAVTTNEDAAAVVWSLDGTQQETAVGADTEWTFSWQLPAGDGFYDVSAQAFDSAGFGGEVRSVTVVVNRYVPAAPEDMVAARNDGVVEARWSASRERDVIGYRVYREAQGSGAPEVACEFTSETTCVDTTAPARTGSALDYWVVAIDRDASDAEREGEPSARVNVNAPNSPPNPPLELILAKDADGNNILQWTPAAVPDPDGDPIEYVVYRDGTEIRDRYDQVPGTQTTLTDYTAQGAVTHDYWVAAVDDRLAESTLLGPVTG